MSVKYHIPLSTAYVPVRTAYVRRCALVPQSPDRGDQFSLSNTPFYQVISIDFSLPTHLRFNLTGTLSFNLPNFNLLYHLVSIYRITEFQITESWSFNLPNHLVWIYRICHEISIYWTVKIQSTESLFQCTFWLWEPILSIYCPKSDNISIYQNCCW